MVTSQQMLNTTEIILIKHTCCGMLSFSNADAVANISKNLGPAEEAAIQEAFRSDFLPFGDLEGTLKEEVQWLKESPLVNKGTKASGWIYQLEDGRVRWVV
ncbi:carbonate dehydratase [Amylocarpus encephaloides]|uniref:Carbonate dehydratase n=1 Tax=Amylocarpus encephaloides TaxID=45428 RepID=A0A9P8C0M5_9HELO|nr:carbonate dehydratase [Amylocarpus encephaloides]